MISYLTDVSTPWRDDDYRASIIVRGMKREPFNSYTHFYDSGTRRRFDQTNIEEFMPIFLNYVGKELAEIVSTPISIVPIPNSGMAARVTGPFRAVQLAEMMCDGCPSSRVDPVLVWGAPRSKQHHTSGYRHYLQFEQHLRLEYRPQHPVVLFDDVLTSGSQIKAAARFLARQGSPPIHAIVGARAIKTQLPNMLESSSFEIDLRDFTPALRS